MSIFLHSIPTWLELVSLSFFFGTLVCRLWILSPTAKEDPADLRNLFARLWFLFGFSIAVIMTCSIGDLVLRTAEMSGSPVRTVFPVLPAVIVRTHFGKVWLIRMAGLVLSAVVLRIGGKYRETRTSQYILLFLGTVIAFTESATGHAADSGDFSTAEIMDLFHLIGSLVWSGGLFVLSLIVLPVMVKAGDRAVQPLARLAARFSRIAGIAVGAIAITSLYNAWTNVGSMEALFGSPYGKTIISKIILFVLLLVLAAINRYLSVPRLQKQAGLSTSKQSAHGRVLAFLASLLTGKLRKEFIASWYFLRYVRFEAFLMLGLLLCVAILRHEVPARHFAHLGHAQTASGHLTHDHHPGTGPEALVRLETDTAQITAGAPVSMKVHLEDHDRVPLEGLVIHHERVLHAIIVGEDLNVFAHIHPEDLGPITDEMLKKSTFPLRFTFPKAGEYIMGLDFATEQSHYSKRVSLSVTGQPRMAGPKVDFSMKKDFGPYHVILKISPDRIKANRETILHYSITEGNKPVTDLGPYLGAPMHLAVVRMDLTEFIHTHGFPHGDFHSPAEHRHISPSEHFGPEVDAAIIFPAKGVYKIFSEVKHQGKVLLFDFMVKAE